jgi:hypothetical protein
MTDAVTPIQEGVLKTIEPVELTPLGELISKVTTNPATLEFPQDRWGFTSDIRKSVLRAASSVKGQDDKHELLISTLAVLITHIKLRKDSDAELRLKRLQEIEDAAMERAPRERVSGPAVSVRKDT